MDDLSYEQHVKEACANLGFPLQGRDLARLVDALKVEDAGRLPPPGRVAALLMDMLGRNGANRVADAAMAQAMRLVGGDYDARAVVDGSRFSRVLALKVSPGDGYRDLEAEVVLELGKFPAVDLAARTGDAAATAAALASEVVPKAEAFVEILRPVAEAFAFDLRTFLVSQPDDWEAAAFLDALAKRLRGLETKIKDERTAAGKLRRAFAQAFDAQVTSHASDLAGLRLRRQAGYHDYPNLFPIARRMKRRLTLIVGPTNSGKTYEALAIARKADRAKVLSPLRLLALEHFETLQGWGLAAGMVTGEEVAGVANPSHVSQTIETLDVMDHVDVAVIDEVQMLADADRGWAWTEAVFGVAASHVVMTGSLDCVDLVARVAALSGEPLEVRRLTRKNPLHAIQKPVPLDNLRKGDAVVTFSRRDLFELREKVIRQGLSVASVYGALSPEVRRGEARRFREGEADVLVATDAIGMGLNIGTLERVIFSATYKFDGERERSLTDSEIRQIAGRAGRFGFAEAGYAGVLEGANANVVSHAIAADPRPLKQPWFYVKPTRAVMRLASEAFPNLGLYALMEEVVSVLSRDDATRLADMSDALQVARLIDGVALPLESAFAYTAAPVDLRSPWALSRLQAWAREHARGEHPSPYGVSGSHLEDLEHSGKMAVLYLWLARRFPLVYTRDKAVTGHRRDIDARIAGKLKASSTAREAKESKGKRKSR